MVIKLRCPECWAIFEAENEVPIESPCCGAEMDMPAELDNIRQGEGVAPRLEGL